LIRESRAMDRVRIFIVDDHRMFRQGLTELLLKKSGFNVVGEAADGREAIGKLARVKPDIVLLDISMPEMDGLTAIEQIRKLSLIHISEPTRPY